MNPLTHVYFALELFKGDNLSQEEKDHLIVGSIIPDLHISGLIQFQRTHTEGLKFFHSLSDQLHKYFALGMVLHGAEPKGLDYYAHNGEGYIQQKYSLIFPTAKKYEASIGKIDGMTIHYLTEFAVENLMVEKDSSIVRQTLEAFQNPKIRPAITAFSSFCGFSERKNRKIISLLSNKHLLNYFINFSSPETTSQNWLNLCFYRNLKKGKGLPFKEKVKRFTKFSYYNFKRKISDKKITQMFQEINFCLRGDIYTYFEEVKQKIRPLKDELLKNINPEKS